MLHKPSQYNGDGIHEGDVQNEQENISQRRQQL